MSRRIRVATTSFATLEDVAPPFNLRHPDPAANVALAESLLETAGRQDVDLVCLPETFKTAGLPFETATFEQHAEPIPGETFNRVADYARRYNMYVAAGFPVLLEEGYFNVAALIDRNGNLAGLYKKKHPTEGEISCGVIPGSEVGVFDTDFGRVGLAICFDLNWAPLWSEMAERDVELICWLSAYPGGLPLQAYAWQYQVPIISSVWPYNARIIELTGREVASTSRWGRIATYELDLDKRLFHTDGQSQHIQEIQTRYGRQVQVETFTDEHIFTLSSTTPSLSVEEIIAEFGLVEFNDYLRRCTGVQEQARIRQE